MAKGDRDALRAAVIGCGRMGAFTSELMQRYAPAAWLPLSHADAITSYPRLELAGLCDVVPETLEAAHRRFRSASTFTDHRTMAQALEPDLVTIATRTPERPAIIADVVSAGVRALHLEKPLCNSARQLIALETLLASRPVACTYGTLRRYMPIYRRARDLANSGRYGRLLQIEVAIGRAPLFWAHPHSVDLVLFLAGDREVEAVCGRFEPDDAARRGGLIDGDPIVQAIVVQLSGGVTGFIGQRGGYDVSLACSEAVITVESDGRRLRVREADGEDLYWDATQVELPDGARGGTGLALERLVEGLQSPASASIEVDKQAMLKGQRTLLASVQSHFLKGAEVNPRDLDGDIEVTGRSGSRYA